MLSYLVSCWMDMVLYTFSPSLVEGYYLGGGGQPWEDTSVNQKFLLLSLFLPLRVVVCTTFRFELTSFSILLTHSLITKSFDQENSRTKGRLVNIKRLVFLRYSAHLIMMTTTICSTYNPQTNKQTDTKKCFIFILR